MTIRETLRQQVEKASTLPTGVIEYNFDLKEEGITDKDFGGVKHILNDKMPKGKINLIYTY